MGKPAALQLCDAIAAPPHPEHQSAVQPVQVFSRLSGAVAAARLAQPERRLSAAGEPQHAPQQPMECHAL